MAKSWGNTSNGECKQHAASRGGKRAEGKIAVKGGKNLIRFYIRGKGSDMAPFE